MAASKMYKFTLLFAAGLIAASCGSKSSDSGPSPDVSDQKAFTGDPGKFAALYTGTCVLQTPDRSYTNCSTSVRIKQTGTGLFVRTRVLLNPSNHSKTAAKLAVLSEDEMTVQGKILGGAQGLLGVIGELGFSYNRKGHTYRFARIFPDNYEYTGRFFDDSGRSITVTGRVQRGSVVHNSDQRTNVQKRTN